MSENLEIEFKSMLTEDEYHNLIQELHITDKQFFIQENIYFDTKKSDLKQKNSGLRIRLFSQNAEATLKTPEPHGRLETNDIISLEKAQHLITNNQFLSYGAIVTKLKNMQIQPEHLNITGKLVTKRTEIPMNGGLLVLDHSWYNNKHDFELEFEVEDFKQGKISFDSLLKKHGLEYRPAMNKVQRMLLNNNNS